MAWVQDSSVSFGTKVPAVEEKKFPYWILLGLPLLIIPFVRNN